MKLIFALFLMLIGTTVAINYENKSLRDWYMETLNNMRKIKSDNKFYTFTNKLNLRCMTHQMDYTINREKLLNFAEAMILLYGSGLKCMDEVKHNSAWELMIDSSIEFIVNKINENNMQCFKMALKRLDPDSKYVNNFDERTMTMNISECEQIVDMDGLNNRISKTEKAYGSFSSLTREALDRHKFKKILLTLVVLGDKGYEMRSKGRDELIKELKLVLNAAFLHCV